MLERFSISLCKSTISKGRKLATSYFKGKNMERIRLKLKAYDHRVLDRTVAAIVEAVKRTGADVRGPVPMPTKIKRYTVLKSPHVNKDSREQFEMRIHARMLDIVAATPDTVDSLTKLDLAPEVNVEVRAMGK
jgi:small subunit ribosomal protein S10